MECHDGRAATLGVSRLTAGAVLPTLSHGSTLSKPLTRLSPRRVADLPWAGSGEAPSGLVQRTLAVDPESGAATRFVRAQAEAGWSAPKGLQEEIYVLRGGLALDGRAFGVGSYVCLGTDDGDASVRLRAGPGYVGWHVQSHEGVAKPSVRLTSGDIERLPWRRREHDAGRERVLVRTAESETVMIHVARGAVQKVPQVYDVIVEETLFLEGTCEEDGRLFDAGSYTCFPAGVPFGPFRFHQDHLSITIKNLATHAVLAPALVGATATCLTRPRFAGDD